MSRCAFRLITLAVLVSPRPGSGDEKANLEALQGHWKLVELRWAEKDSVQTIFVTAVTDLVVKGKEMTVKHRVEGGTIEEEKNSIELDTSKNPKVLKMTATTGKAKGKNSTSIYAIEGDTLERCVMKNKLPSDFTIKQGQDVNDKYLFTYQRVKQ